MRISSAGRHAGRIAAAVVAVTLVTTTACANQDDSAAEASATPSMTSATGSLDAGSAGSGSGSAGQSPPTAHLPAGQVEVMRELDHDPAAFTQGLELHDSILYESTGMIGTSWVSTRPLDGPADQYTAQEMLPGAQFGEGLAVTSTGSLWQLTWKDGIAYQRDAATLAEQQQVRYDGEGWGLCAQATDGGERLVMSDGTATLTFRDPATFDVTGTVEVTLDGKPLQNLNELECVDGDVYANVWMTDDIVRIDPASGAVTGAWNLSQLMQPRPGDPNAVLNGIAAVPGSDTFLVTGKLWPKLFEVRLK